MIVLEKEIIDRLSKEETNSILITIKKNLDYFKIDEQLFQDKFNEIILTTDISSIASLKSWLLVMIRNIIQNNKSLKNTRKLTVNEMFVAKNKDYVNKNTKPLMLKMKQEMFSRDEIHFYLILLTETYLCKWQCVDWKDMSELNNKIFQYMSEKNIKDYKYFYGCLIKSQLCKEKPIPNELLQSATEFYECEKVMLECGISKNKVINFNEKEIDEYIYQSEIK